MQAQHSGTLVIFCHPEYSQSRVLQGCVISSSQRKEDQLSLKVDYEVNTPQTRFKRNGKGKGREKEKNRKDQTDEQLGTQSTKHRVQSLVSFRDRGTRVQSLTTLTREFCRVLLLGTLRSFAAKFEHCVAGHCCWAL